MRELASVTLFGGVFTFLAIAVWSANKTRERELYYRSELLKKVLETPGQEAASVLAQLKEDELARAREAQREKRRGLLIGGLTVTGVGVGLMIFMRSVADAREYFLVGLIPLFVGLALLAGSRLVKED
jgi:hypothetical protein